MQMQVMSVVALRGVGVAAEVPRDVLNDVGRYHGGNQAVEDVGILPRVLPHLNLRRGELANQMTPS
jgi:hypothetical protein